MKSLIVSSVTKLTVSVVTTSRNLGADHDVIAAPANEALRYLDEPTRLNGSVKEEMNRKVEIARKMPCMIHGNALRVFL